ncbi:MAG: CAP domain-containing protein [Solirubrobacteraceae bacterium]
MSATNLSSRWLLCAMLTTLMATMSFAAPALAGGKLRHRRTTGHHVVRRRGRVRQAHRAHPARPASGVSPACPNADTPATSASPAAMRAAVDCLINQERTSRGLPALGADPRLDHSAQLWNSLMVLTGVFSHGTDFASRISAVGFIWSFAGENIATGFSTPRAVVSAWMASPDHCQNILDPNYGDVGTGVSPHSVGSFAGGPSTWTQDFALWMGHNPPSANHGPASGCPYKS